jgi:hypothetical protein
MKLWNGCVLLDWKFMLVSNAKKRGKRRIVRYEGQIGK